MTTDPPTADADITAEDIDAFVPAFYARIREHEVLGPIFARAITPDYGPEWQAHEEKIAGFWRAVFQINRGFRGSPMQAHVTNGEVRPEHFPLWLETFHATARDMFPANKAARMSAAAERVGQGLRWGLEGVLERMADTGPPKLR